MQRERKNPYQECPIYETKQFIFRMVDETDAEDLLGCYSDPTSAKIFNSDNCTCDFVFKSVDEVRNYITFWYADYQRQYYVRFSIVEKKSNKAIGTIEIFARKEIFDKIGRVGVLRLDLPSDYEKEDFITEILEMIDENFFEDFAVDNIITKAIPEATERVTALEAKGYKRIPDKTIVPYDNYLMKSI